MGRDVVLLLVLFCLIGGYFVIQGARVHGAEHRAQAATERANRLQSELTQSRNSVRIVTHYVDRVRVVRERGATITKEIPVYVTAQADARCDVPVGFVSVHDAAAQNLPLDRPTGDPDAPAAGVTLSVVAETVAGNYGACHETREQVIGLQEYVLGLQAIEQP